MKFLEAANGFSLLTAEINNFLCLIIFFSFFLIISNVDIHQRQEMFQSIICFSAPLHVDCFHFQILFDNDIFYHRSRIKQYDFFTLKKPLTTFQTLFYCSFLFSVINQFRLIMLDSSYFSNVLSTFFNKFLFFSIRG